MKEGWSKCERCEQPFVRWDFFAICTDCRKREISIGKDSHNWVPRDPQRLLDIMRFLRNQYLDNMEGCDADEFNKWERLYNAASTIADAMYTELYPDDGSCAP